MEHWCSMHGFAERVRHPTRRDKLLDVVWTDLADHVECRTLPKIANHSIVAASLAFAPLDSSSVQRICWQHSNANWPRLRNFLGNQDCSHLSQLNSSAGAVFLKDTILRGMHLYIPKVWRAIPNRILG